MSGLRASPVAALRCLALALGALAARQRAFELARIVVRAEHLAHALALVGLFALA